MTSSKWKVIIYMPYINDTSLKIFFLFLKLRMEPEMTEPIGVVDLSRFRLVDIFSAVKDVILYFFPSSNSCHIVVLTTVALEIGLDCSNAYMLYTGGGGGYPKISKNNFRKMGQDGEGWVACKSCAIQSRVFFRKKFQGGKPMFQEIKGGGA